MKEIEDPRLRPQTGPMLPNDSTIFNCTASLLIPSSVTSTLQLILQQSTVGCSFPIASYRRQTRKNGSTAGFQFSKMHMVYFLADTIACTSIENKRNNQSYVSNKVFGVSREGTNIGKEHHEPIKADNLCTMVRTVTVSKK